jgi:uncharacterized protein YjbJ (UPF0337 family)
MFIIDCAQNIGGHYGGQRIASKARPEQAKGKVKEVIGKVTGDSKLKGEGKADQLKGKVQNAVGGLKDSLRGK